MNLLISNTVENFKPAPGLDFLLSDVFFGPQIIFWFLLCAGLIVVIAKYLVGALEVISCKVTLSRAFLGGIVMSLVVSLPELVASIFGGIENTPMYSMYNETGSNMMQVALLSIIMLLFFCVEIYRQKKYYAPVRKFSETYQGCFGRMSSSNKFVLGSLVVIYFFFFLNILSPIIGTNLYIPGWNVSIASILPFVIWIGFAIWTLRRKNHTIPSQEVLQSKMYQWNLWSLWTLFIFLAICLIVVSYINSGVVEVFTPIFNIPEQTTATILLSFGTSLPEIVSLIFLCRAKDYYLGLSTITGGALVNASFVFYTDCIVPGATFKDFHEIYLVDPNNVEYLDAYRMQFWIIVVLIITTLMFLTSRPIINKSKRNMTINLSMIVFTYIVGFILISTLAFPS